MELKDKLASDLPDYVSTGGFSVPVAAGNKVAEASAALASLGYSQSEIGLALKGLDVENLSVEELVRSGLRAMVMQ